MLSLSLHNRLVAFASSRTPRLMSSQHAAVLLYGGKITEFGVNGFSPTGVSIHAEIDVLQRFFKSKGVMGWEPCILRPLSTTKDQKDAPAHHHHCCPSFSVDQ
jgi:hypothetical protein